MEIFMDEKDIDFCKESIELMKKTGATFIKKDTSLINNKAIFVYKNQDGDLVIKFFQEEENEAE